MKRITWYEQIRPIHGRPTEPIRLAKRTGYWVGYYRGIALVVARTWDNPSQWSAYDRQSGVRLAPYVSSRTKAVLEGKATIDNQIEKHGQYSVEWCVDYAIRQLIIRFDWSAPILGDSEDETETPTKS